MDQLVGQVKLMGAGLDEAVGISVDDAKTTPRTRRWRGSTSGPDAATRRVQEGREGVHLAGRPLGAVPGANQTQSVQRRGDGSGQRDQRHRSGRAAEHHTGGCHDIDGRIPRRAAGHPRLLRARHPIHHHRDPHRRPADPDGAAACDRRAALSGRFRGAFRTSRHSASAS